MEISDNVLFVGDNSDLNIVIQKKLEKDGLGVMVYSCENRENFERDFVSLCGSRRIDKVVFGHIHSDFRPIQFNTPAVVDKIVTQNFSLFIELMRVLLKRKLLSNCASVVVLSSIGSTEALKAKTIFCAAKAALDASVRCLAKELAPKGVRLNSILKGGTDVDYKKAHIQVVDSINDGATAKRQVLGMTKADEIANLTAFLLSDAVPTMTGTSIVIDGGYTL